ncbi:MAG: hypothetical protein CL508_06035 [Actinobacteria bacterium]|nr:hypothetical protein [Actinomycetota bacterium]|tara:strand:- start:5771 stop:6571 length:801 start_codon:yes stop_codon:yes gene_type:complete
MASYSSYKKVSGASLQAASLDSTKFDPSTRKTYGVKWIFGSPNSCSNGCCCLWTIPAGVRKVQWEIWGAGGSGAGACSTSRCHHYKGAGGGYYNTKTIDVTPGDSYSICAAGNGNCCRFECNGCRGCASYVNGTNLSNFCAIGGYEAYANTSWNSACMSYWDCCIQSGSNGGDFGFGNHSGAFGGAQWWFGHGHCHCLHQQTRATSAPLIGTEVQMSINWCWMRCGCWTVPYGNGGQSAMSSYCGGSNCCGQGGMGGPGLVRITYY